MDALVSRHWSAKVRASVLLSLIALGLIGNYFKYPIFLNIDFLFGSIFVMIALQVLGLGSGIAVGAITAVVTYFLWNHPYAIVIMTLEVSAVGLMMRHKNIGVVLADAIYWLVIGMPLVYVFYHGVMDVPVSSTSISMTKQAVNGVANALLARLMFSGYALASNSAKIAYRDLIYNLLSFFALYPALILLMVSSHTDFLETDSQIRNDLVQHTRLVSSRIDVWSSNRARAIGNLAALAVTLTPTQMQPRLAQAHNSDVNFLRIGLLNREAVTTAYSPLVDDLGNTNIGKNFADRPFIPRLQRTLKPMLSEVVMGQIGRRKPVVSMLAPIVKNNVYDGYVAGVLSLNEVKEFLDKDTQSGTMLYTLLDTNGNVILTNHNDLKIMQPFVRSAGSLSRLDESISQWIPKLPANTPISERWKSSFYVADSPVGGLSEWRVILEQPVAPFQRILYAQYTNELALLFVLLFTALALAEFLSRKVVARTEQLARFTKTLPNDLSLGLQPAWPESTLTEHHNLIERFKEMAVSLSGQFRTNKELTASLENRVAERTAALVSSEAKFRHLIDNSHDIIFMVNAEGIYTFVSPSFTRLLGHPMQEVVGCSFVPTVHPDDVSICLAALNRLFSTGQGQTDIEYRHRHIDGSWHWFNANALPVRDDAGQVIAFQGTAKEITAQKALEEATRQLAFYDPLTALPNRRLLLDRLAQAVEAVQRSSCYGALMFMDLDNFKPLNDQHGHAAGDSLLKEVAHRLTRCVRGVDTVARIGGDEFVVLVGGLTADRADSIEQSRKLAEKVRTALAAPYVLPNDVHIGNGGAIEHHCTVSIGIALFGKQRLDPEEILKCADAAMYEAKAQGRNMVRFFDPQMQAVVASRTAMESGLREAVEKDQFVLHYQAQVTAKGEITGAEALLRWLDSERGMVSPAEFIPMAEETGLILPIGNWVLETACNQLARWASQPGMAHLTVAVNVSARQIHQKDFVDQVLTILERTEANPDRLKLELTESVLVEDIEDVIAKMNALQGRGVTFSLDDFGTGYSSLAYLQRLPLDQLKIDQGFVRDILINPNDAAIAKMVVALAASLRLTVIPEGVETEAQRQFLSGLGCHNFQGYLFSRPLPNDEFEAFVERG